MRHAALRAHFGGDHRARIDAAGVGMEPSPLEAEDHAEWLLANGSHLTDPLEVIVNQPFAHPIGYFRQQGHQLGSQERGLHPGQHRLHLGPDIAFDDRRRRFADQLAGGNPHRDGKAQLCEGFLFQEPGDVHRRAKESFGAADVEVGMAPAARFDDRGHPGKDLVEGAMGLGVAARVGGEDDHVRADTTGQGDSHSPGEAGRPGLGAHGKEDGPVGAGGRDYDRPRAEPGVVQRGDGGAEGGGIDEEYGSHGKTEHIPKIRQVKWQIVDGTVTKLGKKGKFEFDLNGKKQKSRMSNGYTKVKVGGKKTKAKAVKVGMACKIWYEGNGSYAGQMDCK